MKGYLLFFFLLFAIFSVPGERAKGLRAGFVGAISPSWQKMGSAKIADCADRKSLENEALRAQVAKLRELVLLEGRTLQMERHALKIKANENDDYYARRLNYLAENIQKQMQALPAHVIFRESGLWTSGVWINVGEKDNRALKRTIVAKNSPVLHGNALVGVVEQVEESRALIRLMTDAAVAPSVRAVRGGEQNRAIAQEIDALIGQLSLREDLAISRELIPALKNARASFDSAERALYLAKGTLNGAVHSKWRARASKLRGIGFNSDFADEEGAVRHLRTGAFADGSGATSIVKVGDLLVTTGMDGLFPPDLPVATVSAILPLHEGGCAYEIEALSLVGDFNELNDFFVLPPI